MLDTRALEGDRREVLDVQEVRRRQMPVALFVLRVQRSGVDSGHYGGSREIIFVEGDLRGEARESPFDGHDTHVFGGKLHLSVHRIDGPGHADLHLCSVAYTTVCYAIVCQATFCGATTLLGFEYVD